MSRNIVLCCDGTANEFASHNTNVVKLYSTLRHDPATQATFYHPGLGTMEPEGVLTPWSRRIARIAGQAIGYGLANDIRDAYVFLMRNYERGDKVYLFGFSRGAYTARAVASLLHLYGLIRAGNEPLVPYAIRMMMGLQRGQAAKRRSRAAVDEYFDLARQFKSTLSRQDCAPWFVGVWDTVSSDGWVENPLKLPYVSNNPDIVIGRHAISIDERRAFFRSHLWRAPSDPKVPRGPRDVKQVWFPGVHSDVGGGYSEAESGLSKVALEWMLEEAQAAGLLVDGDLRREILGQLPGSRYVAPDPKAPAHESLCGAWHIAEFIPKKHFDWQTGRDERRMNRYRRRTIPGGSLVHVSAFERGEEYSRRLPPDVVRVGRPAVQSS